MTSDVFEEKRKMDERLFKLQMEQVKLEMLKTVIFSMMLSLLGGMIIGMMKTR